jgi:hypothetical protein
MKRNVFIGFAVANLLLCLWVFREALWGQALLAPLDILPAVASKYHFMDPASSGIPGNHYIVDQVTADLPIHYTIYNAWRNGEVPWWNPYTWAGRPLLADAHYNGADPIRTLADLTFPSFEWAYNWTKILHFIAGGLGMLLLLRHWRFSSATCVLLALTYEFAGCQVLYFAHPWIQASLNYYPLLWLVWDSGMQKTSWWRVVAASFLVAGIFYAGNLQSHSYLILFAAAFGLGYAGWSWSQWKRILPIMTVSGALGAALALPVLLGELELFSRSLRTVHSEGGSPLRILNGLASVSAVYPWAMGTFRTLDLSKMIGGDQLGFHLFVGSAGFMLAVMGSGWPAPRVELEPAKRTALGLVCIYLIIISTPLQNVLYARSAGLALPGLILLAGLGVESLGSRPEVSKRWGWFVVVMVVVVGVATNAASLLIYPRFLPKVRQMVFNQNQKTTTGFEAAHALRDFQIRNLANEVSFKNPETLVACAGLLAVAGICLYPSVRRHRLALPALLALNLAPVMMFDQQFIPVDSVVLWQRMMADNTEQRRVAAVLADGHERLLEISPASFDRLYPLMLGHFFEVHTVHGYSSLWLRSFDSLPKEDFQKWLPQAADYIYQSDTRGLASGELKKNPNSGSARFQWVAPANRGFRIEKETLNTIRLLIESGPEADLLWTDTYYPGWTAGVKSGKVALQASEPIFSKISVPSGQQTLVLHYEPTFLRLGITLAGAALALLGIISAVLWFRGPKSTGTWH